MHFSKCWFMKAMNSIYKTVITPPSTFHAVIKPNRCVCLCERVRVCMHTQKSFSAFTGSVDDSVSQNQILKLPRYFPWSSNTHITYTQHQANGNKIRNAQWTKQKEKTHTQWKEKHASAIQEEKTCYCFLYWTEVVWLNLTRPVRNMLWSYFNANQKK